MTSSSAFRPAGLLGCASFCALLGSPALAQNEPYFYGGVGLGQSRAELNEGRLTDSLLGPGLRASAISNDKRDTGYKAFLGYQFDRYLGVEAGYVRFGDFGLTTPTVPAGTLSGRIKLQGAHIDLVGSFPLGDRLSLIGRVGALHAKANDRFAGTGAVTLARPERNERKTGYKVGMGLQYAFGPSFMVRGEAERYRVPNGLGHRAHVDLYSISLVFPFGHAPQAAARAMSAPAPQMADLPAPRVAAAPAPVAPVVQPPAPSTMAPAAPQRARVSFSAESLFGFDQAVLQPEGRDALDSFAKRSEGARFDVVIVEGHTDRLGSADYNQRLSLQRADAVKAYLVGSGKFDAMKVSTIGKGETEPVTQAADCTGTRQTAALIACLKPDRRVEVEMSATR